MAKKKTKKPAEKTGPTPLCEAEGCTQPAHVRQDDKTWSCVKHAQQAHDSHKGD